MAAIDVEDVLSKLTLPEKVGLLSGVDYWHTYAIPEHGVPSLRMTDGPNGARGTKRFAGVPAACFPCGTALGATFNQALLREAGIYMGHEARAKGSHILLGPCINMQRSPLGGRGFESISEDPVLAGLGAAALVQGIQSTRVAACIKHFVCNDQEHQRNRYSAVVSERALREIYLKPFQIAQRASNPLCYMTSYNKLNGIHCSEHQILSTVLRGEWGWKGLIMSDWYGTYSTSEAVNAGLDVEMPGPPRWRSTCLTHAVSSGKVSETVIDDRARAVLELVRQLADSDIPEGATEGTLDTPEMAAFLRKVANEGIVLLKNDGSVLPLKKNKSTLLVGEHIHQAVYCGGGSSAVEAYYAVPPWDGVSAKMEKGTALSHALGAYTHKELPLLGPLLKTDDSKPGFHFRVYNEPASVSDREIAEDLTLQSSHIIMTDFKSPRVRSRLFYATASGAFTPTVSGDYTFGLCVFGTADLYVDDRLVIDNSTMQRPGTSFYGSGTAEERAILTLVAGQSYRIRVEFASAPAHTLRTGLGLIGGGGLRLGCSRTVDPEQEIATAVKAAQEADQVVVVASLGKDWESEGHDRSDMKLPGYTDQMISEVAKANPNTVVVLQTGTPVEMPWIADVRAVLQTWYLGNEVGNAIADVLFGDVNPSGKLSLSFPRLVSDNPAYLNYRSEGGRTIYGEDVYIGYRYYDAVARPPLFHFGHGLSYTTFSIAPVRMHLGPAEGSGQADAADNNNGQMEISVTVALTNSGSVAGAEVIQVYVSPRAPDIGRPPKELQGFAKEFLQPGETKQVTVSMPFKHATSFWDEDRHMWKSQKDTYDVLVGTSSAGPFDVRWSFDVEKTTWWKGL